MTERPRYPKSTCAMVGCASWSRVFPGAWLCARHWRSIRRSRRTALRKLWRAGLDTRAKWKREQRLWAAVVREATLKAAGL